MLSKYPFYLVIFLISSCQGTFRETQEVTDLLVADPEIVGMVPDSLQKIRQLIQEQIEDEHILGGVALVAKEDQVVYFEASGFRDEEKSDMLVRNDIFRIASMTKPITSVAVMQLYEEGKLDINDPVSYYIPEFVNPVVLETFNESDSTYTTRPALREIILHDLLTHTSGMIYGPFSPIAGAVFAGSGVVEGWTEDSVLLADNARIFARLPLIHDPGAKWTYSTSLDVLGRVVEVVSGEPLDQYFRKHIFGPLGMEDTYFYLPETKYDRLVDVWFGNSARTGGLNVEDYHYPVRGAKTYFSGGAGLSATVEDYYKFVRALLNGGKWAGKHILKPETVDLMTSNQIDSLTARPGEKFGYGFSIYEVDGPNGIRPGRFSWGGYWHTFFWVDPSRDIIGVLFTNAYGTGGWNEMRASFERIVNGAVVE